MKKAALAFCFIAFAVNPVRYIFKGISSPFKYLFAIKISVIILLLSHGVNVNAQTICETYMDDGPINRTTGYGEERIAPGYYQALAQRYNNLSGTINSVVFWGRANTSSIDVKVRIYNEQTGSGLPGVILHETIVTLPADIVHNLMTAVLSTPLSLTSPNVTIFSIEPFFTSDDFFIRHNKKGDNNTSTPGDGQGLWLNLYKQSNVWYKNLANGDYEWDYDFLILPMASLSITANFTFTTNGLIASFTNTSTNAASYYWDFDDGNNSSSASPSHTYSSNGIYDVKLKAFGIDSTCIDSIIKQVDVSSVGVNNGIKEQKKISINNPVKNELMVISNKTNLNYCIYNTLGELLLNGRLYENMNKIDISTLNDGMYFINFENNQCFKFIKR